MCPDWNDRGYLWISNGLLLNLPVMIILEVIRVVPFHTVVPLWQICWRYFSKDFNMSSALLIELSQNAGDSDHIMDHGLL